MVIRKADAETQAGALPSPRNARLVERGDTKSGACADRGSPEAPLERGTRLVEQEQQQQ